MVEGRNWEDMGGHKKIKLSIHIDPEPLFWKHFAENFPQFPDPVTPLTGPTGCFCSRLFFMFFCVCSNMTCRSDETGMEVRSSRDSRDHGFQEGKAEKSKSRKAPKAGPKQAQSRPKALQVFGICLDVRLAE